MSWYRARNRIGRRRREGGSTRTACGGGLHTRAARSLLAALATALALALGPLPAATALADEAADETTDSAEEAAASDEEDLIKIETPTVTKEVWDGNAWAQAADAAAGETVWYQVTGTLPSNLAEFTFYAYEFHDQLDAALLVDESTVRVEIVRGDETIADVTELFDVALGESDGGWKLAVVCADVLQAPIELEASDTVLLTYAAVLDPSAAQAGISAENYVYLRYTSKAFSDAFGRSTEASAALYTWALSLCKVAADTGQALEGATFSIRASDGRYVQSDGTLANEQAALTTGSDGLLAIPSIDAGTYTVTEIEAPQGYGAVGAFEVTISADLDGTSPALSCAAAAADGIEVDAASGTVILTVNDPAQTAATAVSTALAKTGDALARLWPIAAALAAAAACGAACALVARRRMG